MTIEPTESLTKKPLFNPQGDLDVRDRRMIGGNTTNLNDFNNMKYPWVSDWYRQAMNNFWIPEEINLGQDVKDYPHLDAAERAAYDKILSFLVFLDSIQSANLPAIGEYITANEVNLCLNIQTFQECVHSQSYSYMLDTICSPEQRNEILYQWRTDERLLARNTFIGDLYNEFQRDKHPFTLLKVMMANFILEGVYSIPDLCSSTTLHATEKCPVLPRKSATSTATRIRTCGCSATLSWSCRKKSRSCSRMKTWRNCAPCSKKAYARKSLGATMS